MKNQFDNWNKIKKKIESRKNIPFFENGHIYYTSIGQNIGFEQNGKGFSYNRPVLVIKKFNKNIFLGIPLTSREKKGKFYFEFEFIKGKKSYAILSQIRLFDSKRLKLKMGSINKKQYIIISKKIKELLD